jgi:UDP-N-acetylmuramoyl-tripeptide--D-alanyl-D-alanine ligase
MTAWMMLAQAQALLRSRGIEARLVGAAETAFRRVHSDTRSLQAGDLFVALRGERFDAHDFLPAAREAGAVAALAERGLDAAGLPGLEVPDALAALQALAAGWRARFDIPLVAVAGSNGKTTVTQMIAAILRAWLGDAALATAGNLNNHIGVPLTLLGLRDHRAAVLELGMNHPGETARLAAMAQPTVAVINNAQREHQEFMATVRAVAEEHGAVIDALPAQGRALLPAGDAHLPLWIGRAGARPVWTFGSAVEADIRGDARWTAAGWQIELRTPAGALSTTLALPGAHNVHNAIAAAAAALAAGAPLEAIASGLAGFSAVKGRSQLQRLFWRPVDAPVTLIDDSYNANPDSMRAAIELLAALPAPRWLIVGDMGEVGAQGPAFHAEVGAHARSLGIEHTWSAGAGMAHAGLAPHFDEVPALVAALGGFVHSESGRAVRSVLVKGSRFMRMERAVEALQRLAADELELASGVKRPAPSA